MCKKGIAAALLFCLLLCLYFGAGTVRVYAAAERKDFSCDIEFLRQEDDRCTLQVTVANGGKDFSGFVRLVFSPNEKDACAYDTEITLPEKGKKQFTLTVPERMADLANDVCEVCFLDGKGRELQRMTLKKVFGSTAGITMGILSDDYASLTYLDLGGQPMDFTNSEKPVRLIELDKENLEGYLDGLYFLVIDRYNVESLGEDKINAIQDWVEKGGWLIIGTGKYAEDTLGGFEDFLSVEVGEVTEPGENNHLYANAMSGFYYRYQDAGVDFKNMAVASLNHLNWNVYFEESSENPAVLASIGDGAVAVYACALSDDEFVKGTAYAGYEMLREVTYFSNSYGNRYYESIDYFGQEALALIDREHTNVDFSSLMLLVVAYIALVGPALYFLLRLKKKSEWYWIGAPLLGLVFIGGVYVFGRDIRVANTKVYSVSLQEAGSGRVDTYFEAYRSGTKSWKLLLNDNYEVAGTGFGRNYYYYNGGSSGDYHYLVQNSGDGLSIGMKPQQNFESGFLYASGRAEPQGQLSASALKLDEFGNMSGTVKNDTGHDLTYFAVTFEDFIAIFSDVKAGESISFDTGKPTDRCIYHNARGNGGDFYYNLVGYGRWGRTQYNFVRDEIAALYIGLGLAIENTPEGRPVTLTGLVTDAEKTVAGACDEYAYRCLSSYAELEVNAYAAY